LSRNALLHQCYFRWSLLGSPAVVGPSGRLPFLLGGSEDPWLCVPEFPQGLPLSYSSFEFNKTRIAELN